MRSKEEIHKELLHVDGQIAEMCYGGKRDKTYEELREKSKRLRDELRFLKYRKIATDYEIDVYDEPYENGVKHYRITLHDIPMEIGFIKICYGATCIPRFGHIGYEMDQKYRGHNYTFKALNLLVEEMHERGLDKPTLAVRPENLPSVRVVEKFGGETIYEARNRFDWNLYQVDLTKKLGQKILTK